MLLPILVHERPELVGLQFTDFSVWAVHNVTTAGDVVSVPVERTKCHYGNEERPCLHATWQGPSDHHDLLEVCGGVSPLRASKFRKS